MEKKENAPEGAQDAKTKIAQIFEKQQLSEEDLNNLASLSDELLQKNIPPEDLPNGCFTVSGIDLFARQTIGMIVGEQKSGKSSFAALLMASAIASNNTVLEGKIKCNVEVAKIVYIDTEMPEIDRLRLLHRTLKTAGFDYKQDWRDKNLFVYSLQDFSSDNIAALICCIVKRLSPDVVIIDGLGDLVESINSESQAIDIFAGLKAMAKDHNCAVIALLHLNPGGFKATGWIGTVGQKKVSDTVKISKQKSFFVASPNGRGYGDFNIRFCIVSPEGDKVGWFQAGANADGGTTDGDSQLYNLVNKAPLPCKYGFLCQWIKQEESCSDRTAKARISRCVSVGLLSKREDGNYYSLINE